MQLSLQTFPKLRSCREGVYHVHMKCSLVKLSVRIIGGNEGEFVMQFNLQTIPKLPTYIDGVKFIVLT